MSRVSQLEKVLMERDDMSLEEAKKLIRDARKDMENYLDPEEFMADWFGLEPDYFIDVI